MTGTAERIPLFVSADNRKDGGVQLAIIIAAIILYLPNINFGLWDCWEPHYAETARMMIVRKDWLHPFWSYAYFLSKPILMFWYMAASMYIFGVEEWAIRLPFTLHGVLLVWGVYFFTSRLFSRRAGVLAAVATATAPLTVFLSRQALSDILVVTYFTLAVGFAALALFPPQRESEPPEKLGPLLPTTLFLYLSYTLLGLSMLAKGFLGIGLAAAILIFYILLTGDFAIFKRLRIISGTLLLLLIAAPWYIHMIFFPGRNIDDGKTFFERFILHDNVYRLFKGVHGERGFFSYFIRQLGYALGIWVGFLPFGLTRFSLWRGGLETETERLSLGEKRKRLLFAWWFASFLFLTFSQTKFHHYVFPLVPISAIFVGIWLDNFLQKDHKKSYEILFLVAMGIFGLVIRDVLYNPHHLVNLFVYKYDRPYPWGDPMLLWGINWQFSLPIPSIGAGGISFVYKKFYIAATPQNVMGLLTAAALTFFAGGYLRFKRKAVVAGLALSGFLWALYLGQGWMPKLAKHWSQKQLFETLKKDSPLWRKLLSDPWADGMKNPIPDEPLFAFRMNWRGEKFYSRNYDIQIMGPNSYTRLYEAVQRHRKPGKPVYFLIESHRMKQLKRALGYYDSKRLKVIDRSNNKYLLVKLLPPPPGERRDPLQLKRDERTRRYYDNWYRRWRKEQRRKKQKR